MNFIPASRSTHFNMSRVLTIVIALAAFGATFATSSSLYAQLARYSKDGGDPIVTADRVTKALTQGDPSLAVGDYVEAGSGARHGATFTIPGGADFTIKPESGSSYASIDLTTVGNGSAFRFEDKESNATLNLTNLDYWGGGSGGNNVFLHMDSGENNFLTLNLNNATIYSMKGVISSGNSNSKVKINSNRSLSLFSNVSFGFGNWDNGNGQPVKVDLTFTNENSSFTLSNNTRGVCGSVAFTSGFTSESATLEIQSNSASDRGGAIYSTGDGDVSLTATSTSNILRLSSNTAANSGGFMYSDSSGDIKITSGGKLSLTNNKANSGSGGAIYNVGNGNIDIVTPDNEIYVSNNVAGNNGGMIYNRGEAAAKITFDANKVTVTDNLANNGSGGVIYNEGASMDIKAVAEMTFKRNYASAGNGGAIYSGDYNDPAENVISIIGTNNLTISNNYAGYVPGDNPSAPYWNADGCKGGAIYSTAKKLLITLNAVEGSTNAKLTFENNFATGDGGAIYNVSSAASNALLTIQGNHDNGTVTVSRNKAGGSGGAIYNANAEIDINSKNKMSFQNNKADGSGGAIYNSSPDYDFTLKSIALDINSNSAQENGGAIYLESKTNLINGTNLNLKYNEAEGSGGAIYEVATSGGSTMFQALENIAITDNIANTGSGGAIYRTHAIDATDIGDLSFYANNEVVLNRNYAENGKGGAIYNDAQSNIDFTSNYVLSIKNNKAINGGAIYQSGGGVAFDGSVIQDTPEANFFNNVATGDESTLGEALANDLYCKDELSFVGNGVYTFNGGIYAGSTSISAADVTVYGREFTPGTQTPDTTNHFRFNETTISNDGKLTVQFDEIEDYSGVFTLEKKTENATMLELNTETKTRQLTMEESKLQFLGDGVVEKTGDGVLQVVAAAEGLVEAESFVISSGRVDFAGWVEATLDVEEGGTFSPGSFRDADLIGKAYVIGDVQIEDDGTALFEFGYFPGNKEDVDHHDVLSISNGSFVFDPSDSGLIALEFLKGDEDSWAVNKCWYLLIEGANVDDGDYTYLLRNAGPFNLIGADGNLYLTATRIPEPSTWALMILGAVGLLYLRKKAVKK